MRKQLAALAGIVALVVAVGLSANEHDKQMAAPATKATEVKGQLIDLACFLKHDGKGEGHKSCAQECASNGLPVGILTDDGKIYQGMGKGHEDLKTVNQPLIKYMETKVIAVGEVFEKQGERVIVIEKIKTQ